MIKKLIKFIALSLLLLAGTIFGNNKASPVGMTAISFVNQDAIVVEISKEITLQEVSAVIANDIVACLASTDSPSLHQASNDMMISCLMKVENGGVCAVSAIEISFSCSSEQNLLVITSDAKMSNREYAKVKRATFT